MIARIIADDKKVYYKVKTIAEYVKEEKSISAYRVNKVVKENKLVTTKLSGFGNSSFLEELEANKLLAILGSSLVLETQYVDKQTVINQAESFKKASKEIYNIDVKENYVEEFVEEWFKISADKNPRRIESDKETTLKTINYLKENNLQAKVVRLNLVNNNINEFEIKRRESILLVDKDMNIIADGCNSINLECISDNIDSIPKGNPEEIIIDGEKILKNWYDIIVHHENITAGRGSLTFNNKVTVGCLEIGMILSEYTKFSVTEYEA